MTTPYSSSGLSPHPSMRVLLLSHIWFLKHFQWWVWDSYVTLRGERQYSYHFLYKPPRPPALGKKRLSGVMLISNGTGLQLTHSFGIWTVQKRIQNMQLEEQTRFLKFNSQTASPWWISSVLSLTAWLHTQCYLLILVDPK